MFCSVLESSGGTWEVSRALPLVAEQLGTVRGARAGEDEQDREVDGSSGTVVRGRRPRPATWGTGVCQSP